MYEMQMYNYGLTKKNTHIMTIQNYWRKYKLSIFISNKKTLISHKIIFNIILKKMLKINIDYDFSLLLSKDISIEVNICDKSIISLLKIFQNYIIYSIKYKTYNNSQLKKNLEKLLLLYIINQLKTDIYTLDIKVGYLLDLTNQYINISKLQIDKKLDILKKILNEHIKLVEEILIEYHNLGHQLIIDYIKQLNNNSYFIIYNKFIQSHNIKNKYFNYKNFYDTLESFITYNNIYNFLFIKDIPITFKKNNIFHDKLNTICIFLNYV